MGSDFRLKGLVSRVGADRQVTGRGNVDGGSILQTRTFSGTISVTSSVRPKVHSSVLSKDVGTATGSIRTVVRTTPAREPGLVRGLHYPPTKEGERDSGSGTGVRRVSRNLTGPENGTARRSVLCRLSSTLGDLVFQ